jgi:TonB family protein
VGDGAVVGQSVFAPANTIVTLKSKLGTVITLKPNAVIALEATTGGFESLHMRAGETEIANTKETTIHVGQGSGTGVFSIGDSHPTLRYMPLPVDYRAFKSKSVTPEEVVIEFFIDHDGGVQLPKIVSAKDQALGWAAATAMRRWVFDAPKRNGQPIYVRHQLAFEFK